MQLQNVLTSQNLKKKNFKNFSNCNKNFHKVLRKFCSNAHNLPKNIKLVHEIFLHYSLIFRKISTSFLKFLPSRTLSVPEIFLKFYPVFDKFYS